MTDLKVGDHIYIHRYSPINYTHHGIIVSIEHKNTTKYDYKLKKTINVRCTKTRIAHPVKNSSSIKFMITDLKDFIGDVSYCTPVSITCHQYQETLKNILSNPFSLVCVKQYDKKLPTPQIVKNALRFVNSNQSYCLLTNNCEMFAEYCVTGVMRSVSKQFVDNIKKYISGNEIISNINIFVVDQIIQLLS